MTQINRESLTQINWVSYYYQSDGYGRYSSRFVKGLQNIGAKVKIATLDHLHMPKWMQEQEGLDFENGLTISFMPPYLATYAPGQHWLYSMTEGSRIPQSWVRSIADSGVQRVLVPCEHNRLAFLESGVTVDVGVVPGGTDPTEFPYRFRSYEKGLKPYTFLALGDRGFRKGWEDVWEAFYSAFGGKTTGVMDVRLIIKFRPEDYNKLAYVKAMKTAVGADRRVIWQVEESQDMAAIYSQAHCVVIPSYSEGWGMPHREAASLGVPVITQRYSGLDDGWLEEWALVLDSGQLRPTPTDVHEVALGNWMRPNRRSLVENMRYCYDNPITASLFGKKASEWIAKNQTWEIAARRLLDAAKLSVGSSSL
jgi:glycosyltransferase involved in cell wall biosynthesis